MGHFYEEIPDDTKLIEWIRAQKLFHVATAPLNGMFFAFGGWRRNHMNVELTRGRYQQVDTSMYHQKAKIHSNSLAGKPVGI